MNKTMCNETPVCNCRVERSEQEIDRLNREEGRDVEAPASSITSALRILDDRVGTLIGELPMLEEVLGPVLVAPSQEGRGGEPQFMNPSQSNVQDKLEELTALVNRAIYHLVDIRERVDL